MTHEFNNKAEDAVFRFLVATDTHLGYKEHDEIRRHDSFDAFEEVLQTAHLANVDCILHAGDLFDEAKPSRYTLYRCIQLLRKYCLGDSDTQSLQISASEIHSNFKDPNLNVSIPFFNIHGNHDDPGEESHLSPLDILQAAGYINYFGKTENLDDINIEPILLKKHNQQIALYGLGWIRDTRLHRAFQMNKVQFKELDSDVAERTFKVMLIHQNRYKGAIGGAPNKACIHEKMLPNFLDLVIWGHEHECITYHQESVQYNFHVLQPGSSIQTSLKAAEALPKQMALIEVQGCNYRLRWIPFCSIRPFAYKEITLSNVMKPTNDEKLVTEIITKEVVDLLAITKSLVKETINRYQRRISESSSRFNAEELFKRIEAKGFLPLIRLKIEHTGFPAINSAQFSTQFEGVIVNTSDMLQFYQKSKTTRLISHLNGIPELEIEDANDHDNSDIHDLIFHYVNQSTVLDLLPEPIFNNAIQDFVIKMEPQAIGNFVRSNIEKAKTELRNDLSILKGAENLDDNIRSIVKKRTDLIRSQWLNDIQPKNCCANLPVDSNIPSNFFDFNNELNTTEADEIRNSTLSIQVPTQHSHSMKATKFEKAISTPDTVEIDSSSHMAFYQDKGDITMSCLKVSTDLSEGVLNEPLFKRHRSRNWSRK